MSGADERFWALVEKTDDCWLWMGNVSDTGYGRVRRSRKNFLVHRYAYELLVGPIPEGLQIDHICRVRHCVNPEHMEPVTSRENTLRGEGPTAENARRTHCANGHPLNGDNLKLTDGDGKRRCYACARERTRRWRAKERVLDGRPRIAGVTRADMLAPLDLTGTGR